MDAEKITYPLTIDGLRPSTIPMRRLAEYMSAFAALLGSAERVRFTGVDEGSLLICASAPQEAACEISPRVRGAMRGDAPADAVRAYRTINSLLTADETSAKLPLPGGANRPSGRKGAELETRNEVRCADRSYRHRAPGASGPQRRSGDRCVS